MDLSDKGQIHTSMDREAAFSPKFSNIEPEKTYDSSTPVEFKVDDDFSQTIFSKKSNLNKKPPSVLTQSKMSNPNPYSNFDSYLASSLPPEQTLRPPDSQRSVPDSDFTLVRGASHSPSYIPNTEEALQMENLEKEKGNDQVSLFGDGSNNNTQSSSIHAFMQEAMKNSEVGRSKHFRLSKKAKKSDKKGKLNINMPDYVDLDGEESKTQEKTDEDVPKSSLRKFASSSDSNAVNIEQNDKQLSDNVIDVSSPHGLLTNQPQTQNQNPNTNTNATVNANGAIHASLYRIHTGEIKPEFRSFYEPEAKIFILKVTGSCIVAILTAINVFLMLDTSLSYNGLFIVGFIYPFFLSAVDVMKSLPAIGEDWLLTEDLYELFDLFMFSITLLILYIRILKIVPFSTFAAIPFIIGVQSYGRYHPAPTKKKIWPMLKRIIYLVEALLWSLRLDGFINWEWQTIFCPLGALMAYLTFDRLRMLKILSQRIYSSGFLKGNEGQDPQRVMKAVGLLFYFLQNVMYIISIFFLYTATQAYKIPHHLELLKLPAYLTLGVATALLLLTTLGRKPLLRFICQFGSIPSYIVGQELRRPKKAIITLQPEKQENYLVMLSSTYFRPLNETFGTKSQQGLDKFKSMIADVSLRKSRSRDRSSNASMKFQKPVDMESLREDKQKFDKKFSISLVKRPSKKEEVVEVPEEEEVNKSRELKTEAAESINNESLKFNVKNNISFDNLDAINKMDYLISPKNKIGDDEVLCHICYSNPPNAVLMNCGHGGLCYDCAADMMKTNNDTCHECRATVESIIKIDPNPKFSNIIKGVELNKVIKTMK